MHFKYSDLNYFRYIVSIYIPGITQTLASRTVSISQEMEVVPDSFGRKRMRAAVVLRVLEV